MGKKSAFKEMLTHHTDAGIVLLGFFIVFLLFTRTIEQAIRILAGFLLMGLIPGMALAEYGLARLERWEKATIAGFIGIWVIPLAMYYSSFFPFRHVNTYFIVAFDVACIYLLERKRRMNHDRSEQEALNTMDKN